jgi:hypothetical protein
MAALNGDVAWLAVIGKSLAFLCLSKAQESEPGKYDTVLKNVAFLEGLGLPRGDAAHAAGSTAASVTELLSQKRRAKKAKNAKKKR